MMTSAIGPVSPPGSPNKPGVAVSPEKLQNAAREFEALLLSQILKSATPSESGLLGAGEDQAGDHAMQYAIEEFGRAIAAGGGIGLSKLVMAGLQSEPAAK